VALNCFLILSPFLQTGLQLSELIVEKAVSWNDERVFWYWTLSVIMNNVICFLLIAFGIVSL
jgi:hypothetical protein